MYWTVDISRKSTFIFWGNICSLLALMVCVNSLQCTLTHYRQAYVTKNRIWHWLWFIWQHTVICSALDLLCWPTLSPQQPLSGIVFLLPNGEPFFCSLPIFHWTSTMLPGQVADLRHNFHRLYSTMLLLPPHPFIALLYRGLLQLPTARIYFFLPAIEIN